MRKDIENYIERLTLMDLIGFGNLLGYKIKKIENDVALAEEDASLLRPRLLSAFQELKGDRAREVKRMIIVVATDNRKKGEKELKDRAAYEVRIMNKVLLAKAKAKESNPPAEGQEIDEIIDNESGSNGI